MLTVALTGGIGSGKTEVSHIFERLGTPVIDTDVISNDLVTIHSPALSQIIQHFGQKILLSDGNLDRKQLREIIFEDSNAKDTLEKILHPLIKQEVNDQLNKLNCEYAIIVIPLLLETNQHDNYDRVLLVDCPESLQIDRVLKRDKYSNKEQIEKILTRQASRQSRLEIANDVIVNDSDIETLEEKVNDLHKKYLKLGNTPY